MPIPVEVCTRRLCDEPAVYRILGRYGEEWLGCEPHTPAMAEAMSGGQGGDFHADVLRLGEIRPPMVRVKPQPVRVTLPPVRNPCRRCGKRMDDVIVAEGWSMHPACEFPEARLA